MEMPSRIHRGRRKENRTPRFSSSSSSSSYVTSEQRNVQKNVNINLFLDTGSHDATVSRHWDDLATAVSNRTGATVRGGPRAACIGNRGVKSQRHVLVQTNLSCSDWPFQDVTGSFFNSSSRQQSNLESKLQRCGSENVTRPGDPLSTVDFGPRHSGLDRVTLKGNSPNDFSGSSQYRSQKPTRGFDLHDRSHTCNDLCNRRMGSKEDRYALNPPPSRPSVSERSDGHPRAAHTDSFSSTKLPIFPSTGSLLRDRPPPPKSSSQGVDPFSPGPPLTLGHLQSSILVESEPSSAALQALLRSSQTSADLHGSIQQFKQEATHMGALGSLPWESKAAPLPCRSCFDPGVTTSALLGVPEESCAWRQASLKRQASLARDWALSSTVGALGDANMPASFGCESTRLYGCPVEALDQFWPTAAHSSIDSTSLAFQAKEDYSNPSFCYFGCCSGFRKVPEGKTTCHLLKSHSHQRTLDPEECLSRLFCCPTLGDKDFPLGLPSFDGLELSLETLCTGTPMNRGVTMYGTQRDVHLPVGLPRDPRTTPVHHFGNSSEELGICEPRSEPAGIGGTPIIAYAMDDYTPFLPPYKPSPFRIIARNREHPQTADGASESIVERSPMGPQNSTCKDNDQRERSSREHLEESPKLEEMEDARPAEKLERGPESMDRQRIRPASQQKDLLLEKCFGAWRDHVLTKKAAAQALRERQLLRKGLSALKWALQLRDADVGIAQRSHAAAILASSFHRWQTATAKKRKERAAPQEAATHSTGVPALPGKESLWKCPPWCQLSAEQLKGAAQYSRAEGNLWLQLHRTQGVAKLCPKAQAVRDIRRLADQCEIRSKFYAHLSGTAFRLWRLQKERLEQEEARVQEAHAILEQKRLRDVFRTWRSRSHASRRMLLLAARVQRGLISRCFNAWKTFAEREALSRHCLEHQRARSVGLCFRQWALMVQIRERAKKSLLELLARKQPKSYGPNAPMTETCSKVAKWSQRNGGNALEGLYHTLRLQAAFQIWAARWWEHQQANAFRRALEQRQLRANLQLWHWKALCLKNLACNPTEDPLLEESSLESSGFHSNAPALPVSAGAFGKNSPGNDSQTSISSLGTIEDSGHLPHSDTSSLRHSPDPEDVVGVSTEFHIRASSLLRNCYVGENVFLQDRFQSLEFLSPDSRVQPIVASSTQEGARSGGNKTENQRQLLARCFRIWSAQTRQNRKAQQHDRHTLLARFFISWSAAVARTTAQRMALVQFEHAWRQRLLTFCFEKWKAESARVGQRQREGNRQRRPSRQGATWRRWRKATRGRRAQCVDSAEGTCSYWTRAAAFALCSQQRSSLIAARKFVKMPLSWTIVRGRSVKRLPPDPAPASRLTCSSFCVWLMIYRSQSRTLEPLADGHVAGATTTPPAQIHKSNNAADYRRWLGRKYLRRWRDHARLRRFQDAWKMRHLVRAWLFWKDACRTALVVRDLQARDRLVQWSWKTWRRRCLQSWVAGRFLEAEDRRLLERVFGRWQHLAVLRTEGKDDS